MHLVGAETSSETWGGVSGGASGASAMTWPAAWRVLMHTIHRFAFAVVMALAAATAAACTAQNAAASPTEPLTLVMIEEHGCGYCARWFQEVGPGYRLSDEGRRAPLLRIDRFSKDAERFTRVVYTPTFILLRDGEEAGRILGYPGADFFWSLLADLLRKIDKPAGVTPASSITAMPNR